VNNMKHKVPEDAIKAALVAVEKHFGVGVDVAVYSSPLLIPVILEAFARWQTKNPIVPTDEQIKVLMELSGLNVAEPWLRGGVRFMVSEWIRIMYLAPVQDPLPCPFCGTAAEFKIKYGEPGYNSDTKRLGCMNNDCPIQPSITMMTQKWEGGKGTYSINVDDKLIAAWNGRKETT
jgi:hypothetical protein